MRPKPHASGCTPRARTSPGPGKQTKQVQLIDAPAFAMAKQYLLRGIDSWYRDVWKPPSAKEREYVRVRLQFRNSADTGLGLPLPKGVVRVYERDSSGAPQFVGEDNLAHTPTDENVHVEMGNAFDIAVDRRQMDFKRIASDVIETAWEIRLRNHKETAVTVHVQEPAGGDWALLESSYPGTKGAAFEVEFDVPVAKNGESVLTYRVRSRY